ncbi:MAG: LTA synthase family protein [Zoogloeaceae bacterium]|jgi:phosphoglycerol transferase MdoB-like AlkP superfamily enzyme|nr:LTA synthase family protein [Zoogloeaceae bacterium]
MPSLSYPRLRYLLGGTAMFFVLFASLRAGFYFGLSEVSLRDGDTANILETLGVGLRFDLRLALLSMLPPALLLSLPRKNAQKTPWLRRCLRAWLLCALFAIGLIYIVDFGYYAWLGLRLNASALRFLGDAWISAQLLWEHYPVVPIVAALLAGTAALSFLFVRMETATLDRPPLARPRWQVALLTALCVIGGLLGFLGRASNINPANPVPLRWNDAFLSGNTRIGALGLNPVLFLWDTWRTSPDRYDLAYVRSHAKEIAAYLDAPLPTPATDEELPVFSREIPVQAHRLPVQKPPNVIFIMLESLGGSATGMHGNPLDPTPNLDALARQSWFLRNFYVPVSGTAKTVWASITGIPDVTRSESATRNPLLLPQHTILNAFKDYDKLYAIGGSAGWANMSALIKSSIAGMILHEEGEWKSPNIDVWGISDLALFREVDALLRNRSKERPFFAIIQTADNHPPFTIPPDNDGFALKTLPDETLRQASFRSNAQYNAVRLLDHNLGRFIEMAKQSGYYDNTIFVFYGDHNGRIAEIPFKPRAYTELNLESLHVPGLIHAPALISPRVTEEAVSLIDLLPTMAGLLGLPYRNATLGRDIQIPAPEGERAVPLVLREGAFPLIGVVTKTHLLHMNADGTEAGLFAVDADETENLAEQNPAEFSRLSALARELHESARLMLYSNKEAP